MEEVGWSEVGRISGVWMTRRQKETLQCEEQLEESEGSGKGKLCPWGSDKA